MPKQLTRLIIAFVIFISIFLIIRHFLVPKSFYEYGHYRGDALKDNESHEIKYINSDDCATCHFDVDSLKNAGLHKGIRCQICHGPGNDHVIDPIAYLLIKPAGRDFCGRCHSKNAARSNKVIKQQDMSKHNPDNDCVECHNPHQP